MTLDLRAWRARNVRYLVIAAGLIWGIVSAVLAAEADPRRPAAIQTQEVPVVPAEIFQRLDQYQDLRGASFQGWAPDGKGILIATRFANSPQLHRVYEPGGRREQITFFDEPVSGRFLPRSADNAVLVTMSAGGNENYQIHLLEPDKYRTFLLTDGQSRNSLEAIRRDGSQLILGSNRRNGRDTDLYVADSRRPDSQEMVLQVENEHWSAADWSPDGRLLLLSKYVSINESYPALFDLASRKLTPLSLPEGKKGAVGPLAFAADGKSVYLTTDVLSEFCQLARVDLATGKYHWLSADLPWDVNGLEVHAESGQVAFTVNQDGYSQLYLLDGDQRRELAIPSGNLSRLEFSPDGKNLGFTLAKSDAPADAYSLSLDDGRLTRWTYSEVGGLDPRRFVAPQRIQFPTFDGRMIPAYYFRPKDVAENAKLPVLIHIHGGPESQYLPLFSPSIQYYVNELGVAVLCPNVRGSHGYGKSYLKLDNAELREDSVRDIGALLDWIAGQKELDAERVAVEGGSYGGYMVLASLVHYGDRIRAGVDVVGIANFITFLQNTSAYRRDLRRAEYGDETDPKMRAVFERINPSAHAEKIRSALLVAHGRNDPRVPFSESEQIASKVRGQGRPVWTVYADNEGHGFGKKDNADYLRAVEVLFLKENLCGP